MHVKQMTFSIVKSALIPLLLVLFLGMAAHASDVDMTGKWTMDVKSASGSGTPVFDLKQSGTELSGTYSGKYGVAPVTGTVEGNKFEIIYEMSGLEVVYAGTAEGNTCKGDVDFGGYGNATFTGSK